VFVPVSTPRLLAAFLTSLIVGLVVACGGGSGGSGGGTTQGGTTVDSQLDGSDLIELQTTLDTTYYDVDGLSTEAIFNYIERNGPTDGEGKRGSGLTSVVWGYEWQGGPSGSECAISSMTIKAEMVVTLPRHIREAQLPANIRDNWESYAEGVKVHEQTHVDIYEDGALELQEAMNEIGAKKTCDLLEAEIKRVWTEEQSEINARQAAFHNEEYTRLARQRGPLSEKIDDNRAEIASLQRQIDNLGRELRDLSSDIEELVGEIDEIDDQVKKINESQQSPQDRQAQLVVLLQQRNALQMRHNETVDEHNDVLGDRNARVLQRDNLINETNQLVDLFNWTR
jgi:predicted secreted Zn-dependent protease